MNNRTLLIVFAACLVLLLAGKLLRGNRASSFDPMIVSVDTSKVDRIVFNSGGIVEKQEFELKRTGSSWEAIQGNIKVAAQPSSMQAVLSPLVELKAKRVVTDDKTKYAEYEIDEDQASKLTVWQGKKKVAELYLGGFRFDQVARTASSFIRKANKPDVYLIDGFTSMGLKARFEQFRDKKLVKVDAQDLTKLEWMNSFGQRQAIQKEDGLWYYAGMEAVDSNAIKSYLAGLVNSQGSDFSELTSTQGLNFSEKLTLSGNNMTEPTIISAFIQPDSLNPFLIHSTANPGTLFESDSTGLHKRIFADLRQFWPDGQ